MRKTLVAALVWLAVLGPGFAKADPFLTPLVASALSTAGIAGSIEILGTTIAYASIVSYTITAGAVAHPTILQVAR